MLVELNADLGIPDVEHVLITYVGRREHLYRPNSPVGVIEQAASFNFR